MIHQKLVGLASLSMARIKKAEVMGPKKYSKAELKIENDSPVLTFSGKDGKPRIIIGLDKNDNPVIRALGKDGQMRSLTE